MRIINKKYLLIILLVGVILTGVVIFKPKEKVKLDNVILKQEVNNKTFAMYKEDDDNKYVKVEGNKFPDMYVLNLTKSKCIDNNGKELENVLSYENDKVTITSGNTTYCYLYFDKSLGLEIKEKNPNKLSEEIKGAMYRFQGQQKDDVRNYICFGTNDQNTCKGDTDHYMYRIIGIEAETGRVKVIKKEALNEKIAWADNYGDDIKFPDSKIYEAINGTDFLQNEDYIQKGWIDKITDNTWYYGDTMEIELGQDNLYEKETGKMETKWYNYATKDTLNSKEIIASFSGSPNYQNPIYYTDGEGVWHDTVKSKISLIYVHDYTLSLLENVENCYNNRNDNCSSWITNDIRNYEWTMTRYGWAITSGWYDAYCFLIDSDRVYFTRVNLTHSFHIRPVFFIDASQTLKGGIGTITNPFIIQE